MEDLYSIHPGIPRSSEYTISGYQLLQSPDTNGTGRFPAAGASAAAAHARPQRSGRAAVGRPSPAAPHVSNLSELIKSQIASHPRYPALVSAYIDCRKVGAPPEMASLLEEIGRGNYAAPVCNDIIGADPELDEFMESYCQVMLRFKEELSKPFHEATSFLTSIEMQLKDLCKGTSVGSAVPSTSTAATATSTACSSPSDAGGSTEGELSFGEADAPECGGGGQESAAERGLKEMLMMKYSGYLSTLRKEFLKKRKKGKLPKDARSALLDWWKTHYRWPYPTEEEKAKLGEVTGLNQKQINNWFINQRKRHWKPSEDMRLALVEGVLSGGSGAAAALYFDARTLGP